MHPAPLSLQKSLFFRIEEFEIQQALLEVGGGDADADRIAEAVDLTGAAAAQAVLVFLEFEEIALDFAERDHALDVGRFDLDVHAPLGNAGDVAVVLFADVVLHILD